MPRGSLDLSAIEAVVFDKDGVLADSESINLQSAIEVFRARGIELGVEDERTIVGRHPRDYMPSLSRRFGIDDRERRRMIDEQDAVYTRLWWERELLVEGARDTLRAVRARRLGVGLATSSSRREVRAFVDRFDLADCFDVTLCLDDVRRAKPDPEIYLEAAQRFGLPTRQLLVVEDSEHGIRAAKAAGALCVAVRTRHVPADLIAMADARIDSVGELIELFDPPKG